MEEEAGRGKVKLKKSARISSFPTFEINVPFRSIVFDIKNLAALPLISMSKILL